MSKPGLCARAVRIRRAQTRALLRSLVALAVFALGCGEAPGEEAPLDQGPRPYSTDNRVLAFDGNDYVSTASGGFPFAQHPQTLSLWFWSTGSSVRQSLFTIRRPLSSGMEIGLEEGKLKVWNAFGDKEMVAAPSAPTPETWHHVAWVFDGSTTEDTSGVNHLFIDGKEVAKATASVTNRTPTIGWLGSLDGRSRFFIGKLDDVRVWAHARLPEEVAAEYHRTAPAQHPNLVSYWTFDETSGARTYDRSGNERHGTLGDGVSQRMPERVRFSGNP